MAKRVKIPGRLESAETGNIVTGADAVMDDEKGKTQVVINSEVDAAIISLAQGKQDNLTFDNAPTEDSPNPVTSAGVYTADKVLSDAIEAILLLIPSAASALNKLVDMQTMNSSIATATASFKGTYNLVSDLHLGVDATHEQIGAALDALSLGADNNDYAYVQVPNTDTAPTEIKKTERYKFNGTNWAYEYDLNNSGFTSAQWNAINSGITALLVSKLSDLPTNDALVAALATKQDNLTFDNVPTAGSPNPVKSGGVYARNNEIVALINAIDAAKQDVLTFDNAPVDGSPNPVKSGGVYTAISALQAAIVALDAEKQNVLTFDSTPTLGSSNPVMSSGIKTELNRIDGNITTLNDLYEALTQSALVIVQPSDTWPVASPATKTIYRVVDRVNTPPQNYSDYMWNGTTMVLMAEYDNAIDPEPTVGSNNLAKSGGIAALYGHYEENHEFLMVYLDGNDHILWGIRRDGSVLYGGGISQEIKDYIEQMLVPVKEVIGSYVDSPEFVEVVTDSEKKILYGVEKNGNFIFGNGVPSQISDYIDKKSVQVTMMEYQQLTPEDTTNYQIIEEGPNGQIIDNFVGDKEVKGIRDFNIENTLVRGFINSTIYNNNDYGYTNVTSYYNQPFSVRRYYPFPAYVVINENISPNIVQKIIVQIYNGSTLFRTEEVAGLVNIIPVYNLIPNQIYRYYIKYQDTDGFIHNISTGTIIANGQERMVYVDGMKNFRDIGGYPTSDGKIVKYGKVYRSAEPYLIYEGVTYGDITEKGINEVIANLNIGVEIDFQDTTSPLEPYIGDSDYIRGSEYQILPYENGLTTTSVEYKNCFNVILAKLKEGKTVFFHCAGGADRTGTFAFILEAICGVSESDLAKDYELTSFSGWYRHRDMEEYSGMISYIKNNYNGSAINEKVENMLISFGVTAQDIADFKSLMTE